MPQVNEFVIRAVSGRLVRGEVSSMLQALATNNSGDQNPPTTYPGMFRYNPSSNELLFRNKENTNNVVFAPNTTQPFLGLAPSKDPQFTGIPRVPTPINRLATDDQAANTNHVFNHYNDRLCLDLYSFAYQSFGIRNWHIRSNFGTVNFKNTALIDFDPLNGNLRFLRAGYYRLDVSQQIVILGSGIEITCGLGVGGSQPNYTYYRRRDAVESIFVDHVSSSFLLPVSANSSYWFYYYADASVTSGRTPQGESFRCTVTAERVSA